MQGQEIGNLLLQDAAVRVALRLNQARSQEVVKAVQIGGDISASTRRLAAYAQDEWDPSAAWSAYAGLRWEGIRSRSESIGAPVSFALSS